MARRRSIGEVAAATIADEPREDASGVATHHRTDDVVEQPALHICQPVAGECLEVSQSHIRFSTFTRLGEQKVLYHTVSIMSIVHF